MAFYAPQRILVVDDDPQVLMYLAESLERAGYAVECTASSVQAIALIDRRKFDLLVSDLNMPNLDGFDMLRRTHISLKVLIISGWMDGMLLSAANVLGATAVMKKPVDGEALVQKVREILDHAEEPAGPGA